MDHNRPSRVLRQPIFHRRAALDELGDRLLDANRTIGQPSKLTVIFSRKITRRHRGQPARDRGSRAPKPVILGLTLEHPRQLAVTQALVRLSHVDAGSTFSNAPSIRTGSPFERGLYFRTAEPGTADAIRCALHPGTLFVDCVRRKHRSSFARRLNVHAAHLHA